MIFTETRKVNLIVGKVGGNASDSAESYKIAIPTKWIKEMNLSKEQKDILLSFDGEKITVFKKREYNDFIKEKTEKNHLLKIFKFYENKNLCTQICADYTDKTVSIKNNTDDVLKTAFGVNEIPCWDDFVEFLESRCIPRSRAGLREYLDALGLCEYNPEKIIKITEGRMKEDNFSVISEEI